MAGITTSSTVSVLVDTIIAEARYTFEHKTVILPLVRKYTLPKGASTINVPKFGLLTVAALTEGVDMAAPQQLSPTTQVVLTAGEVGGQVILTDISAKYSKEDIHRTSGRLLGNAMAKKVDADGAAMFTSFTTHSLGTSATDASTGLLTAAYYRLTGQTEPAPGPFAGVWHPYAMKNLVDGLTSLAAISSERVYLGGVANKSAENVIWGEGLSGVDKLFGIPQYLSGNIVITTACLNALFSKEAIIYVSDAEPTTERERNASLRAWEINHVSRYAFKMYQESYGCLITTDSTVPTT